MDHLDQHQDQHPAVQLLVPHLNQDHKLNLIVQDPVNLAVQLLNPTAHNPVNLVVLEPSLIVHNLVHLVAHNPIVQDLVLLDVHNQIAPAPDHHNPAVQYLDLDQNHQLVDHQHLDLNLDLSLVLMVNLV